MNMLQGVGSQKLSVREATEIWVDRCFDAIQTGIIKKLMKLDPQDWCEITVPCLGDRVYMYSTKDYWDVIEHVEGVDKYKLENEHGYKCYAKSYEFKIAYDEPLPMWSTMWSFSINLDEFWLESNVEAMSRCGFRVYESTEFGIYFGIDGAGYDFYEEHWVPLYKARGLKWHEINKGD